MNSADTQGCAVDPLVQRLERYLNALHLHADVQHQLSHRVQADLAQWSKNHPQASSQARYDQLWQLLDASLCQTAEQTHPSLARLALNAQAQQLDVDSRRQSDSRLWSAPKLKRRSMRPSDIPDPKARASRFDTKISH